MDENDTLTWLISDHLGSTSLTVDASGALLSSLKYTAFGELRSGTAATDYRYTGQRQEAEIGLYFYVSRFFDPYINHFTQPDTIIPDPNNPQAYDRYAYALNNPIRYTDPSGHQVCWEGSTTGNCITTAIGYLKSEIKITFGIILSDAGDKDWNITNASLVLGSLVNINNILNGSVKSLVNGSTFMMGEHVPTEEHPLSTYGGWFSGTSLTFYTLGSAAIRQMNIYHEFGHLINKNNVFSNALAGVDEPSYIDNDYINIGALISLYVSDPNHGSAQAIQASEGNVKEQWADIFANLVVGNIKTKSNRSGSAMYNFAINALFPKNATIRQ
jgi:RHS repeat-associated protein